MYISIVLNVDFIVNGTKIVTSIKASKVNENECSLNHKKSADKWYIKRCQKLRQNRKTKPADKGNYLSLYKISVESI